MNKIDVHHHFSPKFYLDQLGSIGITESYGQAFKEWTPETSLSYMEKFGIDRAILSISTPGVCLQDETFSKNLARECNEYMANLKNQYPNKFGGFAVIPLSYPQAALEELRYVLDELELDGVGLLTNYEGNYLGDGKFDAFFEELNKRSAVVFIHPTDPVGKYDPKLEIANSIIEAPFETTRTVANLIHTGTISRYGNIKYILSHGGGTIPYLAWKIALIKYASEEAKPSVPRMIYDWMIKSSPESGLSDLHNMYYDTALATNQYTLPALLSFAGPSNIVFGSDLPFSEKVMPSTHKDLSKFQGFSEEQRNAVYFENCNKLFPARMSN